MAAGFAANPRHSATPAGPRGCARETPGRVAGRARTSERAGPPPRAPRARWQSSVESQPSGLDQPDQQQAAHGQANCRPSRPRMPEIDAPAHERRRGQLGQTPCHAGQDAEQCWAVLGAQASSAIAQRPSVARRGPRGRSPNWRKRTSFGIGFVYYAGQPEYCEGVRAGWQPASARRNAAAVVSAAG